MALTEFHGYEDSVRWRLTRDGIEIEGTGVERTTGAPTTVTSVWERYSREINEASRTTRVPCALVVATICTESGGKADAVRLEPGYVSDEKTPHKVSVGLTQTLISTARDAMQMSFGRDWLLVPGNAIAAGTNYIAKQAELTALDPPLVAAAYNAGKLYHQTGSENRWKLRQYPIGTGKHCDRFVRFFNDAVFVLTSHATRPAVDIDVLLGSESDAKPAPRPPRRKPEDVEIHFASTAKAADLTPYSETVLRDVVVAADLRAVLISSTARTPSDQARVMYNNLEKEGVEKQHKLYGHGGDQVINVYVKSKTAGKSREAIIADMRDKIVAVGPSNVSRHIGDPRIRNVFDVAPSSVANHVAFERAVRAERRIDGRSFFMPPDDPGYHLEIPQPADG
jgi:hypothetical protein